MIEKGEAERVHIVSLLGLGCVAAHPFFVYRSSRKFVNWTIELPANRASLACIYAGFGVFLIALSAIRTRYSVG